MTLTALPNLHDAVLERVTVDWSRGLVRLLVCAVPGGLVMISAHNFSGLSIPRGQPWGPSTYVNYAIVRQVAVAQVTITLEMQSGDELTVTCGRFEVTHPGGLGSDASR